MSDYGGAENIEDFRRVLDIINHELKALTFLMLEQSPLTITDMRDRLNRFPVLEVHLESKNIYRYLKTIAKAGDGSLAATSTAAGRKRGTAETYRLTMLGEWLQPAVAFGMNFLPSRYGISAWEVMGPMNSRYQRRGSYGKVDIIRSLSSHDGQTLHQLSEFTGINPAQLQYKLDDLSNVAIGSERYPEGLHFVEPVKGSKDVQKRVYRRTGKIFDPGDFRDRWPELRRLAKVFTESDQGSFFEATSLFEESGYMSKMSVRGALDRLERKGYVKSSFPKDFRSYRLTGEGKSYHEDCLGPLLGYVSRKQDYVDFVLNNQPSLEGLKKAAKAGALLIRKTR